MSILVQTEQFEGPLGLLLYLIRKDEMDIFDINIHQITKNYLEYIRKLRELDLEMAGEFVAMAATLIQIKSQMLLPEYNEAGELIENEDPRRKLVQKLLEYQKYQEASHKLYSRPLLNRDFWARGVRENLEALPADDEVVLEENPLFSLISMYRAAMRRMTKAVHRVVAELQSVAARILELKERLKVGESSRFSELITVPGEGARGQVLITFLSLLELAKIGFVSLFQSETYGEIHIETKRTIDRDVISQVENYDNAHAMEKADQILQEAEMEAHIEEIEEATGEIPKETGDVEIMEAASDEEILAAEAELAQETESMPVEVKESEIQ